MKRLWQRGADDDTTPALQPPSTPDPQWHDDGDSSAMQWEGVDEAATSLLAAPDALPVDDLMSHVKAAAVKFPLQEPRGYAFRHVEQYVQDVAEALQSWADAVHSRDLRLHALDRELELRQHDINRLRTELELFRVQGDAVVTADGSYLMTSQVPADAPINVSPGGGIDTAELDALRLECDQAQEAARNAQEAAAEAQAALAAVHSHTSERDAVVAQQAQELAHAQQSAIAWQEQAAQSANEVARLHDQLQHAARHADELQRQLVATSAQLSATTVGAAGIVTVEEAIAAERVLAITAERDDALLEVAQLRRQVEQLSVAAQDSQQQAASLQQQWTPTPESDWGDLAEWDGPSIALPGAPLNSRRDPLQVWLPPEQDATLTAEEEEPVDPRFVPQPQFRL